MTRQHVAKPALRQTVLDYLAAHTGITVNMAEVAQQLGLNYDQIHYQLRSLRQDGFIDYRRRCNGIEMVRVTTPPNLGQPCVHCGILTHHRDRAGYCCSCATEAATGHPAHYWHSPRITVEGLPVPEPAAPWTP